MNKPNAILIKPSKAGRTLALDLGTKTGWAILTGQEIIDSGTEVLATEKELRKQRREGRERTSDIRFSRLAAFIDMQINRGADRIVFEDVIFSGSTDQTQLWGSFRAAIWVAGLKKTVEVCCVPVATLKVFATGRGNAMKPDMAQALATTQPTRYRMDSISGLLYRDGRLVDDNEVDAVWLALYAQAVDAGQQEFLSVYQRKAVGKAAERARRALARAEKRERTRAREAKQRAHLHQLIVAIKAMGKCCGVSRGPASHGRAVCPKCGTFVRVPKAPPLAPPPSPSTAIEQGTASHRSSSDQAAQMTAVPGPHGRTRI